MQSSGGAIMQLKAEEHDPDRTWPLAVLYITLRTQNFILVSSKATSIKILLKSLHSIVTQSSEKMQLFANYAKYGAYTIAKKPDNMQKFAEDEDGDVMMINENRLRGIQYMIITEIDKDVEMEEIPEYPEDVEMEEIPDYPEDVIMEDLDEDINKQKAKKLLNHDGQQTRDGKKNGKNKAKKEKNKLNKSCWEMTLKHLLAWLV